MNIRPIHTEADHEAALALIEALWDAQPGTPEHDEIEVLSILVSVYEDEHWPILSPDPLEAIKFHMEQNGFKQKDLAGVIGSVSRASGILINIGANCRNDPGHSPGMGHSAGVTRRHRRRPAGGLNARIQRRVGTGHLRPPSTSSAALRSTVSEPWVNFSKIGRSSARALVVRRTLFETECTVIETDARSCSSTHDQ